MSSLISIQFFVLNLVGWFGVLSNKFIILIFHYFTIYSNFKSSIISWLLFWRYMYLSLGISWPYSFATATELFCCDFFGTFVILQQFYFQLPFVKKILTSPIADFLAWSKCFWLYLPLKPFLIFLPIFLVKNKNLL